MEDVHLLVKYLDLFFWYCNQKQNFTKRNERERGFMLAHRLDSIVRHSWDVKVQGLAAVGHVASTTRK